MKTLIILFISFVGLTQDQQNVFYWKGTDIKVEVIEKGEDFMLLREKGENGECIDFWYPSDKFKKAVVRCWECELDCY